jgi:LytS/YehU family sensor histidine kinase
MKRIRRILAALGAALTPAAQLMAQQAVAPTFQSAVADIRTIAIASGSLAAGLVGLVGLVRTAWKLSQGDTDSVTSLVFAIVGIVLGFLANTFIT